MIPCIALCASHVDSPQRLNLLKCSIDSMLNQNHKVPIWISISTLEDTLDIYYENIPDFHIFVHTNTKKSQFEHFWFLIQQIEGLGGGPENLDKTFYIFFDDDDFSHPERTNFYANGVDIGQNSLLATNALLMMYESEDTEYHSLETCNGETSVNGHEYFMYCVRATIMKRFCQILLEFGLLSAPICDILLISVLFSTRFINRSCQPLPWIYAYSVRDQESKKRHVEMDNYLRMIQIPGLLERLEQEFQIEWYEGYKGYISIYGHDEFINATPFPLITTEEIPPLNEELEDGDLSSPPPPNGIFSKIRYSIYNYWKKEPYFFFLVVAIFLVAFFFLVKWLGKFIIDEFTEWVSNDSGSGGNSGGGSNSGDGGQLPNLVDSTGPKPPVFAIALAASEQGPPVEGS